MRSASQVGTAPSQGDLHTAKGVEVIEDRTNRQKNGLPTRYTKGRFLGKGGFAKCYEVQDMDTKRIYAAKIIAKASISKPRTQAKLRSEISIHRSLDHEKVAHFYNYFEDTENVYIILELCPNQTLNDFMRKRPGKRLPESECMFYLTELVVALKYLHGRRVIHRDLKLGNLFLDAENHLKVGDFGLAAQLEHHGEKKRTICGTPNYIAPEILEGKHGHSYEVDVWSLGVILYTMLVGRPPFETADVKTTYRRIRYNQYSFPDTVKVSDSAKSLITSILQTDPKTRPSLDEILASPWLQASGRPGSKPTMPVTICSYAASPRPVGASARSETPDGRMPDFARIDSPAPPYQNFSHRDRSPSAHLLTASVQVPASLKFTQTSGGTTPGRPPAACNVAARASLSYRGNDENVVPANGNDCAAAKGKVSTTCQGLPGAAQTPLRSASTTSVGVTQSYTPLATNQLGMPRTNSGSRPFSSRESSSPMLGGSYVPTKLAMNSYGSARSARPASASSPRQPLSSRYGVANVPSASTPKESRSSRLLLGQPTGGTVDSGTGPLFTRTTPSAVRASAAQPAPSRRPNSASCDSPRPALLATHVDVDIAKASCATPPRVLQDKHYQAQSARTNEGSSSTPALAFDRDPTTPATSSLATMGRQEGPASHRRAPDSGIRGLPSSRTSAVDWHSSLYACLGGSDSSLQPLISPDALPEVWVTKWVDYSSKYGVGYIMSDKSIGVYFNDSTKIILAPDGKCFDYITRRTQEKPEIRTTNTFEQYPDDLKKKVTLLRHFKNCLTADVPDKKDGSSMGKSSLPPPAQDNIKKEGDASSAPFELGQAPYVKKWTSNNHAIMFQLSNKVVQIVFFDKTEAVLSSKAQIVTYVDKRSQVCSYPLSNILEVATTELAKRLRYTKDILVNMLGARQGDLGGA